MKTKYLHDQTANDLKHFSEVKVPKKYILSKIIKMAANNSLYLFG